MTVFLQGFLLQSSLILALGAQNLFVLDCGIRKQHPVAVALICGACDFLLIVLGVLGSTSLFILFPTLQPLLGAGGTLFLFYFGLLKLKEVFSDPKPEPGINRKSNSQKTILLAALSFSLLNPHVYLDTLVLIGGYSARFSVVGDRLLFGAGAASFSFLWFISLSLGAVALSRYLDSTRAMKFVSLVSGIILLLLAFKLGSEII